MLVVIVLCVWLCVVDLKRGCKVISVGRLGDWLIASNRGDS